MKQVIGFIAAAALALTLVTGCGTTGGASKTESSPAKGGSGLGGVPDFVNEAFMQASEDVLIGIGTYKIGGDTSKLSMGKTMAETRARADIARQLQVIIKNMVTDYTATSELDPDAQLSFQENITQSLAKAELKGSRTIKMDTVDGIVWVVMEYSKSAAAKDYDAAQAEAKLAVPAAAAFDALKRMDNAFDKAAGGGPIPVGD